MNRNDGRFGTIEAVQKIGVSFERLRYWEQAGIVKPIYVQCGTGKYKRYSYEYMKKSAHFVKELVYYEKYSLKRAVRKLKAKESFYGFFVRGI